MSKAHEKEYIFTGSVELRGVQFFVKAKSLDEARQKARGGDYEEYETQCAETVNWEINPKTAKVNE